MKKPRSEYPRPQFVRENWMTLNGEWEFAFDEEKYDRKILVPYPYQTELSGINAKSFHEQVWYRRIFTLPEEMQGRRILLHFGAVDYACRVWVDDQLVTEHEGGQTSFQADITSVMKAGREHTIRVQVIDRPTDLEIPREKQFWEEESRSIFYTPITGIWQSVWIEAVAETYLTGVFLTPMLDERTLKVEYETEGASDTELEAEISYQGLHVTTVKVYAGARKGEFSVNLDQPALRAWNFVEDLTWSPEHPRLFDIVFRLHREGNVVDEVTSYFGIRKISVCNGVVMLNNRAFYQKLLLDQGYWEESLLTAPTDEDFIKDITLVKEMGFNGVRKHQKVEDPRFLYHADRMGLVVWGEIGSAYVYSRNYVRRMTGEWMDAVMRDYNHPCIIAWTPLNESWGVPEIANVKKEQSHSAAMVYLTKSLDETRLVISNDGWEHTCSDLLTIHDYDWDEEVLRQRYQKLDRILPAMPAGRALYAAGWSYDGEPVLVTEFGGISYQKDSQEGWGYSSAESDEDFLERFRAVVRPLLESEVVQGYCYTQLTDVEQEINGLLTYGREAKVPPDKIREIQEK